LFRKKAPAVAGAFLRFYWLFEGGFRKMGVFAWCFGGELLVDSWWIVGF
jgi:hypothetical protein